MSKSKIIYLPRRNRTVLPRHPAMDQPGVPAHLIPCQLQILPSPFLPSRACGREPPHASRRGRTPWQKGRKEVPQERPPQDTARASPLPDQSLQNYTRPRQTLPDPYLRQPDRTEDHHGPSKGPHGGPPGGIPWGSQSSKHLFLKTG